MHNGLLADPLNPWVKASKKLTSKPAKQKTDRDQEEISRIEFMGSLYLDDKLAPCIPGEVIEAWVRNGARRQRKGKDAEGGIYCDGNFPLVYAGPKNADKLWKEKKFVDRRGVKVGQARVMRTRPRFNDWTCDAVINYDDEYMSQDQLMEFLDDAGKRGILDHRPRFGRCVVELLS